ncbi:hypothetical protein [Dyella subtropica]|uniref:hypothetical protein n=1 Tax=Dyella subtropica TaxID=2992127 RepID=UPI002259EBA3|nr:hypothetical protein [Dyella subtropica]
MNTLRNTSIPRGTLLVLGPFAGNRQAQRQVANRQHIQANAAAWTRRMGTVMALVATAVHAFPSAFNNAYPGCQP